MHTWLIQVLAYIAGKMETDRIYCASVYANADKVFGDKKGAAKLRYGTAPKSLVFSTEYFPLSIQQSLYDVKISKGLYSYVLPCW